MKQFRYRQVGIPIKKLLLRVVDPSPAGGFGNVHQGRRSLAARRGSARSECIPVGYRSCIPGASVSIPQAGGATPLALALPALSRSVKGRQFARRDLRPGIVPQALPWHPGWSVMTSSSRKGRVPRLPEPPSGRVFTPYSGYISQSVEVPARGSLPGTFQRKGSTRS
jgi:hypothetical protein